MKFLVKPFQNIKLPLETVRFSGEMLPQFRVEFFANGNVTAFDVEPFQAVPGSERGKWVANDGVTFKALRQRSQQRRERDGMLDAQLEIWRQWLVDLHRPVFGVSDARSAPTHFV